MLEVVKTLPSQQTVKTQKVRILRAVVLAPHVVGEEGEVYEVPRWMANELVGYGRAERVLDEEEIADPETLVTTTLETPTSRDPKPKKVVRS